VGRALLRGLPAAIDEDESPDFGEFVDLGVVAELCQCSLELSKGNDAITCRHGEDIARCECDGTQRLPRCNSRLSPRHLSAGLKGDSGGETSIQYLTIGIKRTQELGGLFRILRYVRQVLEINLAAAREEIVHFSHTLV